MAMNDLPRPRKWTVMIFMGADNPPNERALAPYAQEDIREMESVGSTPEYTTLIQLHLPGTNPVRYQVQPGGGRGREIPLAAGEANTGDPRVLGNFVKWATHYAKADHYMLVLWGHAYRFAFGYYRNPQTLAVDGLDYCEVSEILKKFKKEAMNGQAIDIIGFDACDVNSVEIAYQVQHIANYLVGSQIGVPLPGWPYDVILRKVRDTPDIPPQDLGAWIIRRFMRAHDNLPSSLTMLDLSRAPELSSAIGDLVKGFHTLNGDGAELERVRRIFFLSQTGDGKPTVDLADLCLNLCRYSTNARVKGAAAALGDLLVRSTRPFVLEHGRNFHQTTKLNGVNIYAPHVEEAHDWGTLVERYARLTLARETGWGEFVFVMALPN